MKKTVFYLLIIILFTSCKSDNEVKNLDEIITSGNLKKSIEKFIEFTKKNNPKDCITIQGNETKDGYTIYFLQNYRPYFLEGDSPFVTNHNQQENNQKYSVFKYKGYDIFVTNSILHKFKIKPQETKEILDHFDTKKELPSKEEVDTEKNCRMMLKIDSKDKVVFERMSNN